MRNRQRNSKAPAAMSVAEFLTLTGAKRGTTYKEIVEKGEVAGIKVVRIGRRILLPRSLVYEKFGVRR